MPDLVLGPLLRYIDETQADVWVETDGPCEVEILGRRARTFHVEGHHYAIVPITGLDPGGAYEYQVALDGESRCRRAGADFLPSTIRTIDPDAPLESCSAPAGWRFPTVPPYTLTRTRTSAAGRSTRLRAGGSHDAYPRDRSGRTLLLHVGDQVYVDEGAPADARVHPLAPRRQQPPGEEVPTSRSTHACTGSRGASR